MSANRNQMIIFASANEFVTRSIMFYDCKYNKKIWIK